MFRFLDDQGDPQPAAGPQRVHTLVEWQLPAALGGTRRWAITDRHSGIVYGGNTYARFTDVIDHNSPLVGPDISDEEEWSIVLADPDGAWATLLAEFHLGSFARKMAMREVGGSLSANVRVDAVGWLSTAIPFDDDDGRRMELGWSNELWKRDRDTALRMTFDAERSLDENVNSLEFADHAGDLSWGGLIGTRERRSRG